MKKLPLAARIYISAVIAAGASLFAACVPYTRIDEPALFVVLLALSSASAALDISLPLTNGDSALSASYAFDFASLLLLGPHAAMFVSAGGALSRYYLNKRAGHSLHRTLFSVASLIVAVQGAGLVVRLLGAQDGDLGTLDLTALALPLAGGAAAYFLLNTGLTAAELGLSNRNRIAATWRTHFLPSAPGYLAAAAASGLAAWLVERVGYWIAPLTFAPIYLTYRTYKVYMGRIDDEQRHAQQTSDLHLATIEALARAIDAKDQTAQSHIRRVQVYATGLANASGLSEADVQGVKTAALLHDIGKLAVPEHILSKPGPLTQEEFQKIRIHPQVGAEIIARVPFPYPVAPLILSHHERWDGKGYPQGLAGEDIPMGARILTIVDYYDAVTTERPYHRALSPDSALAMLRHEAGRALDPRLVPVFIEMLPSLMAAAGELTPGAPDAVPEGPELPGATAAELAPRNTSTAFENIALAHREIYALYEIAQSMGTSLGVADTMALISSKITKLVPWAGCALYLYQPESESLTCRFAAGIDAPRLLNSTLKVGHGLSGWVARNRRPLINANPRVTFDAVGVGGPLSVLSALVCPLYFNDGLIGCLALYQTRDNYYSEDHARLLERIAEQAGPVIHNSITFEQTQEDSLTDALTGLPNRRSMFVHLSRELARAERLKNEIALIVMDIDGFKGINDTYGHHVGDNALREVATALQNALRPYDLCVRYAGDEFIVVLADCSRDAAEAKRLELQARIAEIEMEVRPGRLISLGVSAGAAIYPQDGTTYEALLADADQRMYKDKSIRKGHLAAAQPALPIDFEPQFLQPAAEAVAGVPAAPHLPT